MKRETPGQKVITYQSPYSGRRIDVCVNHEDAMPYGYNTTNGPTLAENEAEALRMIAGGRSDVSLRESKTFDTERLAALPLFAQRGRLF